MLCAVLYMHSIGMPRVLCAAGQVGKDEEARQFLEHLDKDPVVGNSIDCTSYYELEQVRGRLEGAAGGFRGWLLRVNREQAGSMQACLGMLLGCLIKGQQRETVAVPLQAVCGIQRATAHLLRVLGLARLAC
jgi:hypothetical protein